jgi:hypothetical protein
MNHIPEKKLRFGVVWTVTEVIVGQRVALGVAIPPSTSGLK